MTPEELAAFLEQLSENPEAVAELPVEHLQQVADALGETMLELRSRIQSGSGSAEDIEALREGRARRDAVLARIAENQATIEEMAAEAAELTSDLEPAPLPDEEESDGEDDEEADDDAEAADEEADDDEAEDEGDDGVQASARSRLPAPGALNRTRPRELPTRTSQPAFEALVASGDAEGYRANHQYADRLEFADAMQRMARATQGSQTRRKYVVARGGIHHPLELTNDAQGNFAVLSALQRQIDQSGRDGRPEFDPITAAGGFCAPETPYYGFFDILAEDGIWTAPTLGAPRGAVSVPDSPSFQDIVGTAGWDAATAQEWTESDDIAVDPDDDETWKVCYFVPCGTSTSFKVSAAVTCLEYGNFVNKFWPEMVSDTSSKTLKAHTHKVNARNILQAVAQVDATIAAVDLGDAGAIPQFLHNLEFHANRQRDRFRTATDARIQVDVPFWVQGALFNDAVARDSAVTFEKVIGWFTAVLNARNISVQWLQDWQSIQAATDYPAAVDVLMYFPGTFVRLNEGSLDFGVTRDTGSNRRNTFQQFVETFQGVAKVGHYAALIDNIPIYPTGGTGERVDFNGS